MIRINVKNKKDLIKKISTSLKNKKHPSVFFYLNIGSFSFGKKFLKTLAYADYIYPNSFYINKLIQISTKRRLEKLNAEDFFFDLITLCQKKNLKIFLLGSGKETLSNAVNRLKKNYKNLKLSGFPGYFKDDNEPLKKIINFRPELLIVGLGSGYQEPWIMKNIKALKRVKVIITVGNFIDILGGKRRISPKILRKFELEWLYRLVVEPSRIWKRYLFGSVYFFKNLIQFLRSQKFRN